MKDIRHPKRFRFLSSNQGACLCFPYHVDFLSGWGLSDCARKAGITYCSIWTFSDKKQSNVGINDWKINCFYLHRKFLGLMWYLIKQQRKFAKGNFFFRNLEETYVKISVKLNFRFIKLLNKDIIVIKLKQR